MNKKTLELPAEVARVMNDNIAELMLYTHKSEKEVLELLKNSLKDRNQEWELLSDYSILNFHRSTESSIYCLIKWNFEEKYQEIIKYITFICKQKKGKILDFGGGIGELSMHLAKNNFEVDFMEVPGNTIAFAKWRFKKRQLDIPTYTTLNHVGKYDIIICLDVLETLEKPLSHLKKYYELLNNDGILILSIGEVGSTFHPMNLEKNRSFLENIEKHCQDIGFTDSNFENKFHLKIKKKMIPKGSSGEIDEFSRFRNFCLNELLKLVPDKLYLVGGNIRERLLNKENFDYDFAISENTLEISKELARKTNGVFVLLDDERKTGRVVWNKRRNNHDLNFDLATITGNSIEDDLIIRDLTINSIALELTNENFANLINKNYSFESSDLIDPAGGFIDLNNKIIRTNGQENLEADPLRILRVFRFAAKLGFEIAPETLNFIKETAKLILKPAKERVFKELWEIISSSDSHKQLVKMNDVNLLIYLFQDLITDNNLFLKVLDYIKNFELVIINLQDNFKYKKEILNYLNEIIIHDHKKVAALKMVLFLYTLKPVDCSLNDYLNKVESFLKIYTFSNNDQQFILKQLKFSFSFYEILNIDFERKTLFYYFKERQNEVTGSLLINYILGFSNEKLKENIIKIFDFYFEDKILSIQPQLFDGNGLIREFNLKPGPVIGKLLNSLQEAQAEGKVSNYQEATEFISDILKGKIINHFLESS